MRIRKAGIEDIDLLIKLRMDYLSADKGPMTHEEQEEIRPKLKDYFTKWITNGGFAAFIAEADGNVLSTAFLSIVERPPRSAYSSYLVGTVYNVFTYAEFRRKGIATQVMSALMEEAESLGVASVDLSATKDGKPLYEKLGFQTIHYTSMKKKFE